MLNHLPRHSKIGRNFNCGSRRKLILARKLRLRWRRCHILATLCVQQPVIALWRQFQRDATLRLSELTLEASPTRSRSSFIWTKARGNYFVLVGSLEKQIKVLVLKMLPKHKRMFCCSLVPDETYSSWVSGTPGCFGLVNSSLSASIRRNRTRSRISRHGKHRSQLPYSWLPGFPKGHQQPN